MGAVRGKKAIAFGWRMYCGARAITETFSRSVGQVRIVEPRLNSLNYLGGFSQTTLLPLASLTLWHCHGFIKTRGNGCLRLRCLTLNISAEKGRNAVFSRGCFLICTSAAYSHVVCLYYICPFTALLDYIFQVSCRRASCTRHGHLRVKPHTDYNICRLLRQPIHHSHSYRYYRATYRDHRHPHHMYSSHQYKLQHHRNLRPNCHHVPPYSRRYVAHVAPVSYCLIILFI